MLSEENCHICEKKFTDRFLKYDSIRVHPECFKCKYCSEVIKEKSFYKIKEEPVCLSCHERHRFASLDDCTKCGEKIDERKTVFDGRSFHPNCFLCGVCKKPALDSKIYVNESNVIHCVACFLEKEGKECFVCYQPMPFNELFFRFEEKFFHQQCFKCKNCTKNISLNEPFYQTNDPRNIALCVTCGDKGIY